LRIAGPLPLVVSRSYSTSLIREDIGLGFGWTHSLAWAVDEGRRTVRILEPSANLTRAPRPQSGGSVRLPCGVLTRHAWGYSLAREGLIYLLGERLQGRYLLSEIVDRNGNAIRLAYAEGRLVSVLDSVGRVVRVRRHADGHVAAFEVNDASAQGRLVSFRSYEYDARGDLVAAVNPDGGKERYQYDDDHRLIARREPGGLVAVFRYDGKGRCRESYCEREGADGLDAEVPEFLADHETKARGFLHVRLEYMDDCTEVVTSRTIRRVHATPLEQATLLTWSGGVHSFQRDASGEILAYTDALGNTLRAERDGGGRILREFDALGAGTEHRYDARGRLVETIDPLGQSVRYERDDRGNVLGVFDDLGPVVTSIYDARGLVTEAVMPNGGVTRMSYDGLGNRVLVVEPDGGSRRIQYDYLGRVTGFVDERGHTRVTRTTQAGCSAPSGHRAVAPRRTSTMPMASSRGSSTPMGPRRSCVGGAPAW
jgi:YD repeat-containing protein